MNNPLVFPGGVLAQDQNGQPPLSMGTPVLANPAQPQPKPKPALVQGPTGNARGSSRIPSMMPIPNPQINMGGEGLMRIGGAIVGGAGRSFTDAFQAGTDMYGQLQDANRAYDTENYKLNEARRLAEQARQDALRKAAAGSGKGKKSDKADIAMADAQIQNMEAILEGLEAGGLTGFFDGTAGKWADRLGITDWWTGTDEGSKRAYLRQMLQEFKVDQTLTKTAFTKGAISNSEMELFMSPFPDIALDDEGAWIPQVRRRLEIAKKIRAAVAGEEYKSSSPSGATSTNVLDEADAIINGG